MKNLPIALLAYAIAASAFAEPGAKPVSIAIEPKAFVKDRNVRIEKDAIDNFVLAEGGLARAVVVVPKDALPGVKYAANELADYLGRISGTHFMVADAPVKGYKTILVGTPYKPEHPEEICVRVKDDDTLEVTGDRSRGTLYAAYDLLESLGVVFCTRDFDYVPQTNRLEIAGDYAKVDWPFMYAMRRSWSDTSWKFKMAQKLRFHSTLETATKAAPLSAILRRGPDIRMASQPTTKTTAQSATATSPKTIAEGCYKTTRPSV